MIKCLFFHREHNDEKMAIFSVPTCHELDGLCPVHGRQPAPSFNRLDQAGQTHQLSDYHGQWLVVYFYPKDDTHGCTIEANGFKDKYQELRAMNTQVLGVSLDDAESHQAFIDKYDLPFNLLVDSDKQMSRDYGVDGGAAFFSYAKRQTFIINPAGTIVKHFEKVDPQTHVDAVLKALHASQPKHQTVDTATITESFNGGAVYGATWPRTKMQELNIEMAMQKPQEFSDSLRIFAGDVTRVCQKKGCWMILAGEESFARVDFKGHTFLIPKNSQGQAKVYGRLTAVELSPEQIAHFEAEGRVNCPANLMKSSPSRYCCSIDAQNEVKTWKA